MQQIFQGKITDFPGLVEGLIEASSSLMQNLITKENALELFGFTKLILDDKDNFCLNFIVRNIKFETLRDDSDEPLKRYPEIAIKYVEYLMDKDKEQKPYAYAGGWG